MQAQKPSDPNIKSKQIEISPFVADSTINRLLCIYHGLIAYAFAVISTRLWPTWVAHVRCKRKPKSNGCNKRLRHDTLHTGKKRMHIDTSWSCTVLSYSLRLDCCYAKWDVKLERYVWPEKNCSASVAVGCVRESVIIPINGSWYSLPIP